MIENLNIQNVQLVTTFYSQKNSNLGNSVTKKSLDLGR